MVVRSFLLFLTLITCIEARSREQIPATYKFDFGNGRAQPGFLPVTPDTKYTPLSNYGWMFDSRVTAGGSSGKKMEESYIATSSPAYFSIKLPEGNYRLTIWFGSKTQASSTMVRAECRRLLTESVRTKPGEIVSRTFVVHVRDSMIRNASKQIISPVRLKPREREYLQWDDLLTLEFNDSLAKIAGLEITPADHLPVVFLAGNSTVVDQDKEPWASWGQMIPAMFTPDIIVANYAESGETMKAFKGEKRLEKIFSMAKPGDYLFIEFGHNDQKPGGNHLDPYTSYTEMLKEWIQECKKRQIKTVLISPVHRRRFDSIGKIINTLDEYPNAVRKLATEDAVDIIDLNTMSKELYEALGIEGSIKAFVHFPANTFPGQTEKLEDNTHFSTYGAYLLARAVASAIVKGSLSLAPYVKKEYRSFNPLQPIPFSSFYLPLGRIVKAVKPDGN